MASPYPCITIPKTIRLSHGFHYELNKYLYRSSLTGCKSAHARQGEHLERNVTNDLLQDPDLTL